MREQRSKPSVVPKHTAWLRTGFPKKHLTIPNSSSSTIIDQLYPPISPPFFRDLSSTNRCASDSPAGRSHGNRPIHQLIFLKSPCLTSLNQHVSSFPHKMPPFPCRYHDIDVPPPSHPHGCRRGENC